MTAQPATPAAPLAVFKDAMAELPAAVTVVTAWDARGNPAGATVSAVNSLSLDPALLLICLATESETGAAIVATRRFLVHVLCEGQEEIALKFATKGREKFESVPWDRGLLGLPQLDGCAVNVACATSAIVPGGDHAIVLGEPQKISVASGRTPLVYHRRRLLALLDNATELRRTA